MAVIVKRISESPTVQRAVRTVTVTSGGRGAPGINGASAYQIWLDAGNSGTEADFLASLVGPAGADGADGDPGPPNTLAIGTVTTGAPGSSADASITGTAPSQTLNLTIPRGDPGAGASVADLDDVPDSATRLAMTPAERAAIANAPTTYATIAAGVPPGGFFLDTLIKQSSGDYDTAWQNLPALLATLLPPNSWHQYAAVCPLGNINLATSHPTLDGVSSGAAAALYTSGIGVVLLRNQTDPAENGLYDWSGDIEPLTRSANADDSFELTGAVVMVILGTDAGNIYKQTAAAPVVDTDDVVWELVGDASAAIAAAIAAHEAASDPHTQYLTAAEGNAAYAALGHSHAASAISNTPAGNIAATTVQAAIDELDTEKAAASHTHTASAVTDFGEAVQDQIGAHVKAGSGISVSYDDGTGDTTVSASGGGSSIAFADHIVF